MAKAKRPRSEKQLANDKRLAEAAKLRREQSQNKNLETKTEAPTVGAEEILSIQDEALPEQTAEGEFHQVVDGDSHDSAEELVLPVEKQPDTIDQPDVGDLVRQIQELKDMQWSLMRDQFRGQPQVQEQSSVANGKLTGTVDKYSMDVLHYADPRERLADEPKLARFAFSLNYELEWAIEESAYETIDHIRMREPRFVLTLIKIMLDEDTGLDTNGRYDICKLIMHEDPVAALTIARDNDLKVEEMDEADFLNEMRYIRMRDWLLEAFYPSKPTLSKQKRDMVINGKLVSYWEKSAEVDSGEGGIKKGDWDKLAKVRF